MTEAADAELNMTASKVRPHVGVRVFVHQVVHGLTDLDYPAQRWQILAWAEHNGVGVDLRRALHELPPGTYGNSEAVITQLISAGVFVSLCAPL